MQSATSDSALLPFCFRFFPKAFFFFRIGELVIWKSIVPKIIKCTGNYAQLLGLKMREGRFLSEQDSYNNNLVCVLGGSLASRLNKEGEIILLEYFSL